MAAAGDCGFPFDRELILEAAPCRAPRGGPILEIGTNGAAAIDLWCASVRGQANVGTDSISIVPGPAQPAQCTPERESRDQNLLAAFAQITNWRRKGDVIELIGATTLRFRLITN